jgi:hypothetical protein
LIRHSAVLAVVITAIPVVAAVCPCPDFSRPGIWGEARDAITGEHVTVPVIVVAQEGAYVDTLLTYAQSVFVGVNDRPGLYRVTVSAAGYQVWERAGIHVWMEDCTVRTTVLDVRLTPAPPPN